MLRLGLLSENQFYRFDPTTNGYIRCTPQEWQNEMIQEGHYTDEIFVRTVAELLQRQIILYPVIPDPDREGDRITISPSQETTHEPFHIIYYEEANFVNPHYQSIMPRPSSAFVAAAPPPIPNSENLVHGQQSFLSRLSAMNSTNPGIWF